MKKKFQDVITFVASIHIAALVLLWLFSRMFYAVLVLLAWSAIWAVYSACAKKRWGINAKAIQSTRSYHEVFSGYMVALLGGPIFWMLLPMCLSSEKQMTAVIQDPLGADTSRERSEAENLWFFADKISEMFSRLKRAILKPLDTIYAYCNKDQLLKEAQADDDEEGEKIANSREQDGERWNGIMPADALQELSPETTPVHKKPMNSRPKSSAKKSAGTQK